MPRNGKMANAGQFQWALRKMFVVDQFMEGIMK